MFANGDDAKNFITTEQEFKTAFNRFAVCHYLTQVTVLSCSVEDSHPHALLRGTLEKCTQYMEMYRDLSIRSITQQRGSSDGVVLNCDLYEILDDLYLKNVAAYTIIQATKDGKSVMPYDYLYGTGALYFRREHCILPWLVDKSGIVQPVKRMGDIPVRDKLQNFATKRDLPADWLICNGFILPNNYIDVKQYESIFKTHNCFRVFMSSKKANDNEILQKMAEVRGVMIEDLQARQLCASLCLEKFGQTSVRKLSPVDRISLAQVLKKLYHLSYRQLSLLVRISENDLRNYVK